MIEATPLPLEFVHPPVYQPPENTDTPAYSWLHLALAFILVFTCTFTSLFIAQALHVRQGLIWVQQVGGLLLSSLLYLYIINRRSSKKLHFALHGQAIVKFSRLFFGGIILGLIFFHFYAFCINPILSKWFPISKKETEIILKLLKQSSLTLTLFSVALLPAVCEEFFFRGVVCKSIAHLIRGNTGMIIAVIISAGLFGLAHIDYSADKISLARFIPTFFMGLIQGTVLLRTKSLIPTIGVHFAWNAATVVYSRLLY